MKKTTIIMLIISILLCFAGCAKLVSTETQEVEATVTDVRYKASWVQIISTGKTTTNIIHPAQYKVVFAYNDVTLTVNSKHLYDYYKDKVGTTVKCDLITNHYDDGSTRQSLKLQEGAN